MYQRERNTSSLYFKTYSTREKQILLLMGPSEEKKGWHYHTVRKLSTLLRGITSNKLIKTDVI